MSDPAAPPLTLEAVRAALAGYDPALLAAWKVALNGFAWPADCPLPCPAGFAEADTEERMRLARPVWIILGEQVCDEAFTRAWWCLELGRTAEAWASWWDSKGKDFCAELRETCAAAEDATP